ncbi:MAG TPA: D-glucuronyl C5-epimerase family protein, partial [Ktedonobacterales bacterium]
MAKQRLSQIILTLLLLPLAACSLGGGTSSAVPASTPFAPLSAATPTTSIVGFSFKTSGYSLYAWPPEEDLFPAADFAPNIYRDSTGAVMRKQDGHDYNSPVTQAQDGLRALAAYQEAGDKAALRIALADASRLVEIHTEYAGAWWYPYPFDFALYGLKSDTTHAPWYSGMAQGEVLDLFTRLWSQTHDAKWRAAAEKTFDSFLHPYRGKAHVPWVANVAAGYLWLQEYPSPQPDYTINGAFFAVAGIAQYALTFSDQRASLIADGAMTTMLHHTPRVRHPGGISSYSLTHMEDLSAHYHGVVTKQLALSYTITHDMRFAALATQFIADFPIPEVSGKMTLPPGTYTFAQRAAQDGRIKSTKQVTLPSALEVTVRLRYKMQGTAGFWYQIRGGPYEKYWFQESVTNHLTTPLNVVFFSPAVPFTL